MKTVSLILVILIIRSHAAASTIYMEPCSVLTDIVDARWAPSTSISPDLASWLMMVPRRNPPISELAAEELALAGLRFSPATSAPSGRTKYSSVRVMRYPELDETAIEGLPEDMPILRATWSPDGSAAALTVETPEGVELWVADVRSSRARRLTGPEVSLAAGEFPEWLPDGSGIVFCRVPEERGDPPLEDPVPTGPSVQETFGEPAPLRTYQNLLENPFHEEQFEYHLTSKLALAAMDGGVEEIGEARMIWYFSVSPDGRYLIVSSLRRPFSYNVTAWRFPETVEVWDFEGNVLYEAADLPLRESIPLARGSTFEGPRSIDWRSDSNAMLVWVEALDGGDAGSEADLRDRIMMLSAPFEDEPTLLMELEKRFGGIQWSSDSLAIVSEWWWPDRSYRSWMVRPSRPEDEPELLFDRSWEDRYGDPGTPLTHRDERGREVLVTSPDGRYIYLKGDGATPEGDMPFLDRMDLLTLETERLFRSQPPLFERPSRFVDGDCRELLVVRESPESYPNYFVVDLQDGGETQVTFRENPLSMFDGMSKEMITYSREDGVGLSATLYLPPGWDPGQGPLPMVMWAYPREYRTADAAGQISGSPFRFDFIGWWSPVIWLTQGYAVLYGPSMPVVGEGEEEPNDTFVEQLVMNAQAAVDEVVRRGVADPERIALGGHSYGAFMTANLLAHSDLFAAGIAQTGAYNRTLTPFGFQSEDRSLWEAVDTYIEMSPFMSADRIEEPILIIHGEDDDNPGTHPMQSERFFAALKGLGGTARLVMLPLEGHSYRARESILHVLWETSEWLDAHLGG